MSAFAAVFRRDLALAWSAGGGAAAPVGFFLGATTLLPLAMGAGRELMQMAGPPLIWVTAALAVLMTLERLFQADLEDGALDQILLADATLEVLVFAKGLALWLALGLPLALAGAPAAIALQTPPELVLPVVISLAVGMAAFIGFGLIGAALTASVRRGGVLIALLVLPLFAAPIIFGAAVAGGAGFGGAFLVLIGCSVFAIVLGPIAAAACLRLQAE